MDHNEHSHSHHEEKPQNYTFEYIKFGGLMLAILLLALFFSNWFGSDSLFDAMRWFMGLFFLVFGTFKFIGYEMFTQMFPSYDIIAKKFKLYSYLYPFIELSLGVLYLINVFPVFRDLATFAVMSIGAYGIFKSMKSKQVVYCACLGDIIKLPLSTVSLLEDVLMAAMALFMLLNNF